jgi:hypothetical protein
MSVDDRTFLEMIDGITRHGLPVLDNGPSDTFAELRPQWQLLRGGRLWGIYAPIYCYVAAPFYAIDGARGVIRLNFLLLAAVALGTFALARRIGRRSGSAPAPSPCESIARDPFVGVAAAYLTLAAAPLAACALTATGYAFAIACVTWSVERAVVAVEREGAHAVRTAAVSGLLGGVAAGAHLLVFPMLVALLALLTILPVASEGSWFTRRALTRGLAATAAGVVPLLPVAVLNRARFGTLNPISYGPCRWHHCAEVGLAHQGVGAQLLLAAPLLVIVSCALVAWRLARGRHWLRVLVVVAVAGSLLLWPALWRTIRELAVVAFSFFIDLDYPLGGEFRSAADGTGQWLGSYVIKSFLQSSPWLSLVLLAGVEGRMVRRATLLLVAPAVALVASLLLRAGMPLAHALGYPYLHYRYLMPMVPLLAVLSASALRSIPWSRIDWLLLAAIALVVGRWLWRGLDDEPLTRRVLLLRVTLLLALAAPSALWWSRRRSAAGAQAHFATPIAAAVCGLAVAVNLGVDLPALVRLRSENDAALARVAAATPQRFALVGWSREIDPLLVLRRTRDIQFADLYETHDWASVRALLELWAREQRPVYAVVPSGVELLPWLEVQFVPLDPAVGLTALEIPIPRSR